MQNPKIYPFQMLPAEIWNKILYHAFIGQESPDTDTLDNCRKVCREWNEMIKTRGASGGSQIRSGGKSPRA